MTPLAPIRLPLWMLALTLSSALLAPARGAAQETEQDLTARVRELEREIEALQARLAGPRQPADHGTSTDPDTRLAWYAEHVAMQGDSIFADLPWQFLGPTNISGRVTDVAVATPRGKSYAMYVAGASGGVWKTDNEGTSWTPVFEHAASTSIGDVTIAPSDPDTVWIGTGEANIFRSSMAGAGVYKSTDGGASWRHMGLAGTHTIPRIVVHPQDADVVWVASSGHEWTDDPNRGVYKSSDGGKTWRKVFFADERTGVIDLVIDPSDSDTLYAATWQRIRRRWNDPRNEDGYDGSAIHKTEDGGATWREITDGLPDARWRGRIGIDVCRARPEVVYAFIDNYEPAGEAGEAGEGGEGGEAGEGERDSYGRARQNGIKGAEVYRSDDRGGSWRKVSESDRYMGRLSGTYGWVFGQIRVDPVDPDVVYVMGLALNVSRDGGKTFERLRGMHGDHHALWIDPDNPRYLVNGNDGGANVSYDGGKSWRLFTEGLPMVQFFNVACDMGEPFHVYGSIQDHGSRRAVVDLSRGRKRIPAQEWERAPGGEGSSHAVDPTDPDTVYSAGFYGSITRSDLGAREEEPRAGRGGRGGRAGPGGRGGRAARIAPRAGRGEPALRGQWVAPFIVSPHNPRIVYHGMNFLFRSWDRGDVFEKISPDLTWNDPSTMGDIPFHTIFTISESPKRFGVIYAGTDDGRVHVTRDGGQSWREIGDGIPSHRWISRIEASRYDEATVYMAQNGKRHDDFTPYLWKSTDFGDTWTSIVGNIPIGPINVVRQDPKNEDVLYVGTDLGVYVTVDGGERWHALAKDMPTTFVHDLVVHPRDNIMVAATHGRGMFAIDVEPIQQYGIEAIGEAPPAEAAPAEAAPAEAAPAEASAGSSQGEAEARPATGRRGGGGRGRGGR